MNVCANFDIIRESFECDKKKFIKRHQKLLALVSEINQFFQPVVFMQYLTSSIMLCVVGFQLITLESYLDKATVAVLSSAIAFELLIFSYSGQLILDKSTRCAESFYQGDNDSAIVCMLAKKGCLIQAWFYTATLPTMSNILSGASSLIAVLNSLIEK